MASEDATGTAIVGPQTGELIDLATAPPERLADLYDELGVLQGAVRDARSKISEEVHRRMDEQARWTINAGPWKLSGASPARVTYRGECLARELDALVEAGVIGPAGRDAAIEVQRKYVVRVGGVLNLKKLGGRVAEAIDRCSEPAPGSRRLTVTRSA